MTQPFDDVAPSHTEITNYDRDHAMLYICLLDRKDRGRDWSETVRAFFGIDCDREPERARGVYDSHLERAVWLMKSPQFGLLRSLVPYL